MKQQKAATKKAKNVQLSSPTASRNNSAVSNTSPSTQKDTNLHKKK